MSEIHGLGPRTSGEARTDSSTGVAPGGAALSRLQESLRASGPLLTRSTSRQQSLAAYHQTLDLAQSLHHLLQGTRRELNAMKRSGTVAGQSKTSDSNCSEKPKPSNRPTGAAQVRKMLVATRASRARTVTTLKKRRNATSVVGKPRLARRPPPNRKHKRREDPDQTG